MALVVDQAMVGQSKRWCFKEKVSEPKDRVGNGCRVIWG